jgi:hypothetical protein
MRSRSKFIMCMELEYEWHQARVFTAIAGAFGGAR